jgi:hypothetical protein
MLYGWRGDIWGPITRQTILSNAVEMMDSTWSPLNDIIDSDGTGQHTYYSGVTYRGELYAGSNHQDWAEFRDAVNSTPGGSVSFGNDCAGLVNMSWQLPAFYSIPAITSNLGGNYFYALGEAGDGQFVSLLPGDAFYNSGHIFLFANYNPDGTVGTMEQVPPAARRRTWSWSALQNFQPIRRNLVAGGLNPNDRIQTSSQTVVRSCPSFSCQQIWTAPITAQGTIVDGPTTAEKYRWWKVQYDNYATAGWTTEGYLKELTGPTTSCPGSDATAPIGDITINSGGYTNSRAVVLNLSCTDSGSGCAWMRFSSDNSTWSAWEPFGNLKNWVLSSGDGPKNLYVQFADACGNVSVTYGDTIVLQSVTPDLAVTSLIAPGATSAGAGINVTDTTSNIGSGGTSPTTTTFFFSTNATLDSKSISLGPRRIPALPPGTGSTGTTSLTIPTGLSPGIFYIIAKANGISAVEDCSYIVPCGTPVEATRGNNTRVVKITVGPDLIIASLSAVVTGSTINVTDTTQNGGGSSAGSSQTNIYLSANTILDSGDTFLSSRSVAALGPNASSAGTSAAAVPPGITPGTYYVIAKANASNSVTEANPNNNTKSVAIRLMPDLVISSLNSPATASAGTTISVTDTTANIGTATASATATGYYLSNGTVLNSAATLLGKRNTPMLPAGTNSAGGAAVTIPAGTSVGTYYIIANANDSNAAVEGNYKNNTRYRAIKIQ